MQNAEIYKLVYEIVTEAMIVADREGNIVEANPSAVTLFKYPINTLVGMNVDELLPDALRKIHAQHRAGYVQNPQRRSMGSGMDLQAQDANGNLIPVEISLNHAEFDGELRVVALVSDITTRKDAEERMVQINRELEEGVAQRTKE
ncbi:MAG: PAS domain S-box protein, partial [Flavobacteriales bacterium]